MDEKGARLNLGISRRKVLLGSRRKLKTHWGWGPCMGRWSELQLICVRHASTSAGHGGKGSNPGSLRSLLVEWYGVSVFLKPSKDKKL